MRNLRFPPIGGERGERKVVGGNERGGGVVSRMREPRVRQGHIVAAALFKKAERVGPGEIHRDAIINIKRQGRAHPRHRETILSRCREAAEIRLINSLIRRRRVLVANVPALRESFREKTWRAAARIHD